MPRPPTRIRLSRIRLNRLRLSRFRQSRLGLGSLGRLGFGRLRSVRARAAVAAALATLLVFGVGGWWLRDVIRDQWADEALKQATRDTFTFTSAAETGKRADVLHHAGFIVVLENGQWFIPMGSSPGEQVVEPPELLPPAEGLHPDTRWHTRAIPMPEALSGFVSAYLVNGDVDGLGEATSPTKPTHTFVVGVTDVLPASHVRTFTGLKDAPAQRLTVYWPVPTERTETAVATIDRFFMWALPVAVVFVGVVAWVVTGRALRPVDAIRAKMNEIGARATDQRVPVPAGSIEIARLARATNETLDRLEHALVRQRRFVADASHELRSPLAGLRSALEIPLVHPDEANWQTVVSTALADTIRLQTLTDDLLLLASDARGPSEAGERTDLADLVEELAAERGPTFTVTTTGPAIVAGSEVRLGRIIRNLFDNAARYARTEVVATVTTDAQTVTLTVTDDGPGIPGPDRERIFDRFVRLDAARARATGGAGLGLTIVREIVEGLGGTVHAAEGSRFVVRLPAA
ncbi:sensor histidine kinase [Actinomadura rudentiformis]|uniref:histidine kinase n=1 Tax=Actinomadura rudentiformis TaxID=359158 RepID=A0A6H9YG54_9ACTN|nr:HAMP domain-containing sensor histidine kinase [Actinomadura rudentiformis]KAB2340846.1 HAMP domain-containing histidine kinase [Actinomadura rudentiformis]